MHVLSRTTTYHGMVTGQEGKTRDEMLKNGLPVESNYYASHTLTYVLWISAWPYNLRLDVIFVMNDQNRVQEVRFFSPFFLATTMRGYLEVIPTQNYRRLFNAA